MGKFDGIILVSDWDGTIYLENGISEENKKAIAYFTENGGKFTVCSGRNISTIRELVYSAGANSYAISYNGAIISDIDMKNIIYENYCDSRVYDILDMTIEKGEDIDTIVLHTDYRVPHRDCSVDEYLSDKKTVRNLKVYKIVLRMRSAVAAERCVKDFEDEDIEGYSVVRSWATGVELICDENSKGTAIKKLKNLIGARLLVAVGDYENDISMIKAADIGYAVGNAAERLIAVADRVSVPAKDSVFVSIINDLERDLYENR